MLYTVSLAIYLTIGIASSGKCPVVVKNRDTGLSVLGSVPWGSHICLLYDTHKNLLEVLIHYLQAGLKNNEFCLWVTSRSPDVKETREIIRKNIPAFSVNPVREQIEIVPYTGTCTKGKKLDLDLFHRTMASKFRQAVDSGYDGLRAFFDLSWAKRQEWEKATEYILTPLKIHNQTRMLAFCTYPLRKCGVQEYINLMGNVEYTLVISNGKLTTLEDFRHRLPRESINRIRRRYRSSIKNLKGELRESQEKFYKALHTSPEIIIITTLDEGKYLEVNDNLTRVFGYTRDEVVGRSSIELGIWPDLEQRKQMVERIKKERHIQNGKAVQRTKSGENRHVLYSSELLTIGGQPCIITFLTDVTGMKQMDKKEQAIISTAMDGFWITDTDGKFLEVNNSYCRMIGYTREELLKMSISDVEALEYPEETASHMKKIVECGSDRFITRHRCKDGKIIDLEINVSFYNVGEGQLFVFIHDLSRERGESSLKVSWRKNITRLQERFVKEGFEDFEDREIIELLLSLVLPARQARRLAEKSIEEFKTLGNFLQASPEELTRVGLTPASVFCIDMLHKLPIKVLQEKIREKSIYESPQDVFDYLYYSMRALKKEVLKAIQLNDRNQIINIVDLFEGTTNRIAIRSRDVIESAMTKKTRSLIFVHNHLHGDPSPSQDDRRLTRDLVFVGNILQIRVLDHIIIGDDRYFSFTQEGLIQEYETDFLNLKLTGTFEAKRRLSGRKYRTDK
jgi:DNA repair protein RadC